VTRARTAAPGFLKALLYHAPVRRQITLGRRTVSFLEAEGPALSAGHSRRTAILIHAFPLHAEMWRPQLDAVPAGWRFVAPDLPGFGGSDPILPDAGARDSIDDFAADVIDLADHLHIEEAVFVGVSMGGYVTFALFRQAPRYVSGLILADTRALPDSEEGRAARRQMLDVIGSEGAAGVARRMTKLISDGTRATKPEVATNVTAMIESARPAALASAVRHMMTRPDSTPDLHEVHCPTLVIVGEHDAITPPDESRSMARQIGGARLVVVPGAGHLASLEQPEAFNAAVTEFLAHQV
jgi:3-oxoadipate enol-lactonase